jgi:tetratricopeptide (TPR) repeat protein
MSFKEIKELRQAGKLDEALQMANQALESEPENIWNKRAAAWVYYDFLKQHTQLESYDSFKEYLIKIKELQLPQDEKMVFDNCAYQIGKLVSKLTTSNFKSSSAEISLVDLLGGIQKKKTELFQIISHFAFTKPSAGYSFIYKAFNKEYE